MSRLRPGCSIPTSTNGARWTPARLSVHLDTIVGGIPDDIRADYLACYEGDRACVPVANAEFLDERLPNSRVAVIDAGHFVCEEAPAEYVSHILRSIAESSS